jgi:hypothetical protein
MEVENGTYAVKIVAGEPWYFSNNFVNIEGVEAMKAIVGELAKLPEGYGFYSEGSRDVASSMLAEQTFIAKVTDGKLSIQIPLVDTEKWIYPTKLAALEIYKID